MDCGVCERRPAAGFCVECKVRLCGNCGLECEACAKLVCPRHIFESGSYRILCVECAASRDARRAPRAIRRSERPVRTEAETSESVMRPVMAPLPPWKLAMANATLGAMAASLLLMFPGLRRLPLPGDILLPMPAVAAVLPASALAWAAAGLLQRKFAKDRRWHLLAAAVALAGLLMAAYAYWTDPLRT